MGGIPQSTDYAKHEAFESVARVAISDDGQHAMLVVDQGHDDKLAITCPVSTLKHLQACVGRLIELAEKKDLGTGMTPVLKPGNYMVGHSDQIRGCLILNFDPETANERIYAIPIPDCARIIGMMQKTMMELSSRPPSSRIAVPHKRLIRPGGGFDA